MKMKIQKKKSRNKYSIRWSRIDFEVSKDFDVVNAERLYVIDKNNIQKFIDDYEIISKNKIIYIIQ